jgi:hypothetical protein
MPLTYWARDRTAAGSLCRATERYDGCDRKGSRRDQRADVEVPLRALQLCVGVSDAPIVCRPTGLGHRSCCDLDGGLVRALARGRCIMSAYVAELFGILIALSLLIILALSGNLRPSLRQQVLRLAGFVRRDFHRNRDAVF